jgi:nucleotide-binding universal stress UspA family protein
MKSITAEKNSASGTHKEPTIGNGSAGAVNKGVSRSSAGQAATQAKFQNILFATDFSSCSEAVLPYVRHLAEHYGSTVHIVHVVLNPEAVRGELNDPAPYHEEDEIVRQKLEMIAHSDALKNIQHTETIQTGRVWDVISELISELAIDLIVMGTRGRSGMKDIFLGSVAEEIFRRATCPVLTVGPAASQDGMAAGKLATILYATDLARASIHSFDYALELANANHAKLNLLHALGSSESKSNKANELTEGAKRRLENLIPEGATLVHQVFVECGSVAETILKGATEMDANLIVMSVSQGALTKAQAHAPWTIAHQVVCHAPCPVLTVRS